MLGGRWFFKLSSNVDFVLTTEPKVYIILFYFEPRGLPAGGTMNQSYTMHLR